MIIFKEEDVGKKVYCSHHGNGIIISYNEGDKYYKMIVKFDDGSSSFFTKDGRSNTIYEYPSLVFGHKY